MEQTVFCASVHNSGGSFHRFQRPPADVRAHVQVFKADLARCGVSGGDVTEITEGLSEGEPVVVADPSIYSAGMKVGAKEYEF